MIKFRKLTPTATIPTRGSEGAAGFDLYADLWGEGIQRFIGVGERALICTSISMEIPAGYVGVIKSRSSLAALHCVDILAGVIDSDYRGEVKIVMINHGSGRFGFSHGDRIAQILFLPVMTDFEVIEEGTDTARGDGGFGSTGK